MLAADATRVGICFKNTNLMPLEKLDSSAGEIITKNKRFDRCFVPYPDKTTEFTTAQRKLIEQKIREACIHMRTIMSSSNGSLAEPSLSEEQLNLRNNQLLEVFPEEGRAWLKRLYELSVTECQRIATTKLFYLLSFDAPVRSLLPVCLLQPLERLCNNICPENLEEFLRHARGISPAIGDFVSSFYIEEDRKLDTDALDFLKHLVTRVKNVAEDTPTLQAPNELQLYNPPKTGVAYYFTNSGAKIRKARKFSIDGKAMGKDDHSSFATCTKYYPKVARKGTTTCATFMFLWFCPNHGHCYGFHIVNGSEGQKDAAYSLYTSTRSSRNLVL